MFVSSQIRQKTFIPYRSNDVIEKLTLGSCEKNYKNLFTGSAAPLPKLHKLQLRKTNIMNQHHYK